MIIRVWFSKKVVKRDLFDRKVNIYKIKVESQKEYKSATNSFEIYIREIE